MNIEYIVYSTAACILNKIYGKHDDVLCRTHAEIDQHAGQKQLWKSIKERWGWLKQDLIEKFINNCTICALRKPSFHPLAAKPIIARNFLSRIQVINFFLLKFL